MYLHAQQYPWQDEVSFILLSFQASPESTDTVFIGQVISVGVEIPENFDIRPYKVAALNAEIGKIRADFAKRMQEIQDQITKYTCLPGASISEVEE